MAVNSPCENLSSRAELQDARARFASLPAFSSLRVRRRPISTQANPVAVRARAAPCACGHACAPGGLFLSWGWLGWAVA